MKKILLLTVCLVTAVVQTTLAQNAGSTAATSPSVAKDSRCFELRTYYPAAGKFEALHKLFRDHTNKLFVKHGMELVGYWVTTDKEDKLVYMLAHKSREAAKQSWKEFMDDPEWKKVHADSEKDGKLVDKVESVFLAATDYSPIK